MEILKPELLDQIVFLDSQSTKKQERKKIIEKFNAMAVDEAMLIHVDEWPYKSNPSSFLGAYLSPATTGKIFRMRTIADKSGWVIFRDQ